MNVELPESIGNQIIAHAQAEWPNECCGFLAGANGVITHCFPLVNAAAQPRTRFESSPESTFAATRKLRQLGVHVVAVYHSHIDSPAIPSATDRRWNYAPGVVNLIASLAADPPVLRAWNITDTGVVEIGLTYTSD